MTLNSDLRFRFTHHPPQSQDQVAKHVAIRESGHYFARIVGEVVPGGREQALALTKIEEAVMWAHAGLARAAAARGPEVPEE